MAEKLKSLIRNPGLSLPFKAAAFGLLLYYFYGTGGGVLPSVLVFAGAVFFYARPMFNNFQFLRTFAVLLALGFLAPSLYGAVAAAPLAAAFALLFYILLGIKDLVFVQRLWWHELLQTALMYGVLLAFFSADKSSYFVWQIVGVGAAATALVSELLSYHARAVPQKLRWAASAVFGLLLIELSWMLALTPMGFLASTAAATVAAFALAHLLLGRLLGTLSRETVIRYCVFVVGALLLIALTADWTK